MSDEVYLRDIDGTGSLHVCSKGDPGAIKYIPAECPHEIVPRQKFVDILGRVWDDTYESDYDWVSDNMDACVWFLTQQIGDAVNDVH